MGSGASSSDVLSNLDSPDLWKAYLDQKTLSFPDNPRLSEYAETLNGDDFKNLAKRVSEGEYAFSIPVKKLIGKHKMGKKRTVYVFEPSEMMILRLILFQMHQYDSLFSPNLYSFRQGLTVKSAIRKLYSLPESSRVFGFKTDIHNYFNSIPVDRLSEDYWETIPDSNLCSFFDSILKKRSVRYNGVVTDEEKGAMAGIPLAAFFANFYLRRVDEYFLNSDCFYFRYADDILILASSEESVIRNSGILNQKIKEAGLEVNDSKTRFFSAGDTLDFLGFSINGQMIDISQSTIYKIKGRIRRSAKAIRRWMIAKNAPLKGTLKALIRTYNEKFYGYVDTEVSWARWFFPVINTDQSLHVVDLYFQQWIRYVATGCHSKKNYDAVPYAMMVECGYVPLVYAYHHCVE